MKLITMSVLADTMSGEAEDAKIKPEGSVPINIVVKDQNSGEVHFKVGTCALHWHRGLM
jgi:hypothetical protein